MILHQPSRRRAALMGINGQDLGTSSLAPRQIRKTNFNGQQFSGFADWDLVYCTIIFKRLESVIFTNQVNSTLNTHFHVPVPNVITSNVASFGKFIKLGNRVSPNLSFHRSAGIQSKLCLGSASTSFAGMTNGYLR